MLLVCYALDIKTPIYTFHHRCHEWVLTNNLQTFVSIEYSITTSVNLALFTIVVVKNMKCEWLFF